MSVIRPFLAALAGGLLMQGVIADSARLVGIGVLTALVTAWITVRSVLKEDER